MIEKKIYKRGNILFFVIAIAVALTGIILPGKLLTLQEKQEYNQIEAVPEEYLTSSSALAKNVSSNLKTSERLQLIAGQWESENQEAKPYEMDMEDYEAVRHAREEMKELYERGLYPVDLSSKYANWYAWTATSYMAVDTTFHTYAAYYWIISFEKYDGTETHTIWMLDDGTIFLADATLAQKVDRTIVVDATELAAKSGEISATSLNIENEVMSDWMPYTEIDVTGLDWKALTQVEEKEDSYTILQGVGGKRYLYALVTKQEH